MVSGRHVVKADANSRTAQFVTLWGGKGEWRQAVGLVKIDNRLPDDTAVAAVVERVGRQPARRLGPRARAGRTAVPIDARDEVGRRQESMLGDLVTDAMRAGTGADVALLNAGTLRLDDVIRPGPLSNYQLESIFLFPDETRVLTVPLTGARLREVLEHGVADGSLGKGGFLQVSGVSFTYDPAAPIGQPDRGATSARASAGRSSAPATPSGWRSRSTPRARAATGTTSPRRRRPAPTRAAAPRAADLLTKYVADSLRGEVVPPPTGRIVRAGNTNPG